MTEPSAMDQVASYNDEIKRLVELLRPLIPSLAVTDLDLLRSGLSKLDALGPLLAPSEWMYGGADNVDTQRELVDAVAPLVRWATKGLGPRDELGPPARSEVTRRTQPHWRTDGGP